MDRKPSKKIYWRAVYENCVKMSIKRTRDTATTSWPSGRYHYRHSQTDVKPHFNETILRRDGLPPPLPSIEFPYKKKLQIQWNCHERSVTLWLDICSVLRNLDELWVVFLLTALATLWWPRQEVNWGEPRGLCSNGGKGYSMLHLY